MSKLPLRAFVPYLTSVRVPEHYGVTGGVPALADPSGATWRTYGVVRPLKDEKHIVELEGYNTRLGLFQFNERILPAKVRDEHVAKRVKKLAEDEGRAVSKKEYAEIRDEVELDLLPKAFIRRTVVPLIFLDLKVNTIPFHMLLICTSSQKRADDITSALNAWMPTLTPQKIPTARSIVGVLTTLAQGGSEDQEDGSTVSPTTSAVLKGEEKETIRIKDKDIGDQDIDRLLRQGYEVRELGISWSQDDKDVEFSINDNLVFKGVTLPGVKHEDDYEYAMLFALEMRKMLPSFLVNMFGVVNDDEDEL